MSAQPPPPGEGEEAFSEADQQWFDRLTGKTPASADSAASREADVLRRVFELEAADADADPGLAAALSPEEHRRRWEQLQFRLRREQAGAARGSWLGHRVPGILSWKGAGASVALAAGIVLTVVVVDRQTGDVRYYDEPPAMRGALQVVRLHDSDPRHAAEALAKALQSAGVDATVHQSAQTFSVDVMVASDTPAAALDLLLRIGAATQPGLDRIEYAAH